jgi:DNA-binding NarL/FixJ family response regulator
MVRIYPIHDSKNRVTAALKISFDIKNKKEQIKKNAYSHNKTELVRLIKEFPFANNLSLREREVLALVGEGFSNRQIAESLSIKPDTVKSHVCHIFNKLGVYSRTHAAVIATRLGII